MNIGIFDSGLGGLIITESLIKTLPQYNFSYIGDTAHVPYGSRSPEQIYKFTKNCIKYLFEKQNCKLVIIACNTATIAALRRLQQEYLPNNFPDRKILGVVIPTIENIIGKNYSSIGLIATSGTIVSNVYPQELYKLNPLVKIYSTPTPLLVPLIENNGDKFAPNILEEYLKTFAGKKLDAIMLGCTHYPHYKNLIKEKFTEMFNYSIDVISQDEIIPSKLIDYLNRHPEIESTLSKEGKQTFNVTDLTDNYITQAHTLFKKEIPITKVEI